MPQAAPILINIAISLAVGVGLSVLSGLIAPKQSSTSAAAAGTAGFDTQMTVGQQASVRAVFGLGVASGNLIYVNSYGTNNEYCQLLIDIGFGEHDSLYAFLLDGKPAALSGSNADPQGFSIDDYTVDGTPYMWVKYYTGAAGQAADSELIANANPSGRWGDAYTATGHAYLIVTLRDNADLYSSSFPTFGSVWKGLKLYDWRKDSTVDGGSGTHRWGDPSTYEWSQNPDVIRWNWRRGIYVGDVRVLGLGYPFYAQDVAYYTAAANLADESILDPVTSTTFARYTYGREITDAEDKMSILAEIDDACCGTSAKIGGADAPLPAAQQISVLTLTDDDRVAGTPVTADLAGLVSAKKTAWAGQYVSEANGWQPTPYQTRINADLETLIGGRRTQPMDQPYETIEARAQMRAEIAARRQSFPATRTETFNPKARQLDVGDCITRSCSWGDVLMIVTRKARGDDRFSVTLDLAQWDNSIVPASGDTFVTLPEDVGLGAADPDRMVTVSSAAAAPYSEVSGGSKHAALKFTIDEITDQSVDTWFVRYWPTAGTNDADGKTLTGTRFNLALVSPPLAPDTEYSWQIDISTTPWRATTPTTVDTVTTGDEVAGAVADGVITITAFASGIAAPQIVSSLGSAVTGEGNLAVLTTDGKLYRYHSGAWTPAVPTTDITGQITTAQITNAAVTTAKVNTAAITANELASAAVTNVKLAALAVATANIQTSTITSSLIATGAVVNAALASAAVATANLQASAVTTTELAASAVTTAKIASANITSALINSGAVVNAALASLAVATANIQASAVTTTQVAASTIVAGNIAASAIGSTQLASGAVITAKIAAAAITATELASGAVTTAKFASGITPVEVFATNPTTGNFDGRTVFNTTDKKLYRYDGTAGAFTAATAAADLTGTIGTTQIAANAVTTAKLALAAVDSTILANNAVVTAALNATAVTGAKVASATLTGSNIAATTIAAGNIVAGTLTTTQIAAGTIVAGNIAAGTITASNIVAGTLTTTQIAASTIIAGNIASGTITGTQIAAATITTSNLVAGSITAGVIAAGAIGTTQLAAGAVTATTIAADAITASKLVVTNFSNFALNSNLAGGSLDGWSTESGGTLAAVAKAGVTAPVSTAPTDFVLSMVPSGASSSTVLGALAVDVVPGEQYYFEVQIAADSGFSGLTNLYARTFIGGSGSPQTVGSAVTPTTTWQTISGTLTIATGVTQINVGVRTAATTGTFYLTGLKMIRRNDASLIVDGTITAAKIVSATLTTTQIAASTILAANIVSATITATQIAANTIVAGNIVAGTITATEIAANAITATKINAGAVVTASIASNAITTGLINAGAVTTTQIASATIVTGNITSGTITGGNIAATTIAASNIVATTITTTQIASATIIAGNIAASAITATQIASGAITTVKLAAGAVTATTIAAGTITASQIAANTITGANLVADAITARELVLTDFTNLVPDNQIQAPTTAWTLGSGWSYDTTGTGFDTGPRGFKFALTGLTGQSPDLVSSSFPINTTQNYYVSFQSFHTTGVCSLLVTVHFRDSSGTLLDPTFTTILNADPGATLARSSGTFTPPSTAKTAELHFSVNQSTQTVQILIGTPAVQVRANANLIVDGTVTAAKIVSATITTTQIASATITGGNIAAGTITAINLMANTITAGVIAAGAIGATQIASGAITSTHLTAGVINVTTLIADNIISTAKVISAAITGYAFNGPNTDVSITSGSDTDFDTNAASGSINPPDGFVKITCGFIYHIQPGASNNGIISIRLFKNGTLLTTWTLNYDDGGPDITQNFVYTDTPSYGSSITYSWQPHFISDAGGACIMTLGGPYIELFNAKK